MAESKRSNFRWIAGLVGLGVIAIGAWLTLGESPEPEEAGGERRAAAKVAPPAPPTAEVEDEGPALRIASRGRLTLDAAELPDDGPLTLALDLSDEARGSGERDVKIISTDGRRVDVRATPLPGAGSGVRLEIDPLFLTPGRYMIEIETVDAHPLQIRRYVLELR